MNDIEELRKWLVNQTILKVDWDKKLHVFALHLADGTVLIISTQTFGKGVK